MSYNDKKYSDDTIIQLIEKNYLTLKDEDVKEANEFMKYAIEKEFIPLMRQDELFHLLFQRIVYGGSFYKGTRFGKPEEFDLDLVIKLPFSYDYLNVDTNHTQYGYVKIKVDPKAFDDPNWIKHKTQLSKWITPDNYLDQNKFRSWMEKVITTALAKLAWCLGDCENHTHMDLKKAGPAFTLKCDVFPKKTEPVSPQSCNNTQKVNSDTTRNFINNAQKANSPLQAFYDYKQTAGSDYERKFYDYLQNKDPEAKVPAFTMNCNNSRNRIKIDVDLVPVIEFDNVILRNGYKTIDGNKKTWMAVAKPLDIANNNVFWRLGFYEPEKEFLRGELKPVIRMLKKFRDTMGWDSIASYYLETLMYNELENHKNELDRFLRTSKTGLFVFALKKLEEALQKGYLPYFWNPKYNLLKMSVSEMYNYSNRLSRIIRSIDACIEDEGRLILAETILDKSEIDEFKRDYARGNLSKLHL